MTALRSPKQPGSEEQRDWYPYYAGFTRAFAEDVFDRYLLEAQSVVDPWNGSGTTTSVATVRGLRSFGVDVNPALTIIARARLTPTSLANRIDRIGAKIVRMAPGITPETRTIEPLAVWLRMQSLTDLRRIQHAIHLQADCDDPTETMLASNPENAASLISPTTALLYTALFATCRDLLRPFRTSNPTWIHAPGSYRHRIQPSTEYIHSLFMRRLKFLCSRLTVNGENPENYAVICTGTAQSVLPSTPTFDACLASPPYATRIDYVKASLPELSLLGVSAADITKLRRSSTGTPIVRDTSKAVPNTLSTRAVDLIRDVATHGSHGSASYYGPWLKNYLVELDQTLRAVDDAVTDEGTIALVVQDSYYKEIRIDLQSLVGDSLETRGWKLIDRHDFAVTRSLASMNSRSRAHLIKRQNTESLLVFRRAGESCP